MLLHSRRQPCTILLHIGSIDDLRVSFSTKIEDKGFCVCIHRILVLESESLSLFSLEGFYMDWFECQSGAWYCQLRNPHLSLDNSTGAVSRLKFYYDQQHRHLGDGFQDYRMTFTGHCFPLLSSAHALTRVRANTQMLTHMEISVELSKCSSDL